MEPVTIKLFCLTIWCVSGPKRNVLHNCWVAKTVRHLLKFFWSFSNYSIALWANLRNSAILSWPFQPSFKIPFLKSFLRILEEATAFKACSHGFWYSQCTADIACLQHCIKMSFILNISVWLWNQRMLIWLWISQQTVQLHIHGVLVSGLMAGLLNKWQDRTCVYNWTLETHSDQCTVDTSDVVKLFIALSSHFCCCSQLCTYATYITLRWYLHLVMVEGLVSSSNPES